MPLAQGCVRMALFSSIIQRTETEGRYLSIAHLAPAHKVKVVEMLEAALTEKPTIQKLYNPKEKGLYKRTVFIINPIDKI